MALGTTPPRNDYIGNGAVATYTYGFRIYAETDLKITKRNTLGVETLLVFPTNFSVTAVNNPFGGTITLAAGALPAGESLTIRFFQVPNQPNDLRNQGGYFAETIEDEFDRLTRYSQQAQDSIDRSLKLPETEVGTTAKTLLPSLVDRASRFLAFDSGGLPIASTGGPPATVPISPFMQTLLDDTTAAAARTTLGALGSTSGVITTYEILDGTIAGVDLNDSVVNDLTTVTVAAGDFVAIADASDAFKKKKALASGIGSILPTPSGLCHQGASLNMNPYATGTFQDQAHGLGVLPLFFYVEFKNVNTEGGWNPGEHVIMPTTLPATASGAGYTITADGTNVRLSTGGAITITNKAGTAPVLLTAGNWQIQVIPFSVF